MKAIKFIITALTVLFIVEYEGHEWNPCSFDEYGNGACLAIYCPGGTCNVDKAVYFHETLEGATNTVNAKGTDRLLGVWRVGWTDDIPENDHRDAVVQRLQIKHVIAIAEPEPQASRDIQDAYIVGETDDGSDGRWGTITIPYSELQSGTPAIGIWPGGPTPERPTLELPTE